MAKARTEAGKIEICNVKVSSCSKLRWCLFSLDCLLFIYAELLVLIFFLSSTVFVFRKFSLFSRLCDDLAWLDDNTLFVN